MYAERRIFFSIFLNLIVFLLLFLKRTELYLPEPVHLYAVSVVCHVHSSLVENWKMLHSRFQKRLREKILLATRCNCGTLLHTNPCSTLPKKSPGSNGQKQCRHVRSSVQLTSTADAWRRSIARCTSFTNLHPFLKISRSRVDLMVVIGVYVGSLATEVTGVFRRRTRIPLFNVYVPRNKWFVRVDRASGGTITGRAFINSVFSFCTIKDRFPILIFGRL